MNDKLIKKEIEIKAADIKQRLDKLLADKLKNRSRSFIQKLIKKNKIKVNGKQVKKSYKLKNGDKITVKIPPARKPEVKAVEMDLDIIYEDKDIIVVNKPAGLVVHPAPGNWNDTLVSGLLAHTDDLSGIGGVKRPGIVHRLDKNTSGTIVVAKNDETHKNLSNQFKKREVEKIYHAVVKGSIKYNSGKIDAPIGRDPDNRKKMAVIKKNSKKAITKFRLIKKIDNYSYLEIDLKTGRTHQIRVHFSYIGHPVVGDDKYGKNNNGISGQLLHAYKLGFKHPGQNKWVEFKAELPPQFQEFIKS